MIINVLSGFSDADPRRMESFLEKLAISSEVNFRGFSGCCGVHADSMTIDENARKRNFNPRICCSPVKQHYARRSKTQQIGKKPIKNCAVSFFL
jgi:hypothetical protein